MLDNFGMDVFHSISFFVQFACIAKNSTYVEGKQQTISSSVVDGFNVGQLIPVAFLLCLCLQLSACLALIVH